VQNQNKKNNWIVLLLILSSWSFVVEGVEFDNGQPTVLITGSNRNIGLEFVKQFSKNDWNVIATARNPEDADELKAFAENSKNVVIELLDITNNEHISNLASRYQDQTIDILLNNAGLTPRYMSAFRRLSAVEEEITRESFEINALGTMKVIQAFMKNVEQSENGKIIALSSKASSFGERLKIPMMYSYAMSKAALNSMIYSLSFETKKKNVIVISLSPGMVNTTPGTSLMGAIEIDESVTKMMSVIEELTMDHNGLFIDYEEGRTIPW
jgi:NAD(P)-dependent dehydrogenase (short-subunit alcohol dehydrogenase family)